VKESSALPDFLSRTPPRVPLHQKAAYTSVVYSGIKIYFAFYRLSTNDV